LLRLFVHELMLSRPPAADIRLNTTWHVIESHHRREQIDGNGNGRNFPLSFVSFSFLCGLDLGWWVVFTSFFFLGSGAWAFRFSFSGVSGSLS